MPEAHVWVHSPRCAHLPMYLRATDRPLHGQARQDGGLFLPWKSCKCLKANHLPGFCINQHKLDFENLRLHQPRKKRWITTCKSQQSTLSGRGRSDSKYEAADCLKNRFWRCLTEGPSVLSTSSFPNCLRRWKRRLRAFRRPDQPRTAR